MYTLAVFWLVKEKSGVRHSSLLGLSVIPVW